MILFLPVKCNSDSYPLLRRKVPFMLLLFQLDTPPYLSPFLGYKDLSDLAHDSVYPLKKWNSDLRVESTVSDLFYLNTSLMILFCFWTPRYLNGGLCPYC